MHYMRGVKQTRSHEQTSATRKPKTTILLRSVFAIHTCCLFLCCYKTCFAQFGLATCRISGGFLEFSPRCMMEHDELTSWQWWKRVVTSGLCFLVSFLVCLASISSDRSRCALAQQDWPWRIAEAMPCWEILQLARCKNLNWPSTFLLQNHPQSLSIKPNICLSDLLPLGYVEWWRMVATAGFCWQVTCTSSSDRSSTSGMSLEICRIIFVKWELTY